MFGLLASLSKMGYWPITYSVSAQHADSSNTGDLVLGWHVVSLKKVDWPIIYSLSGLSVGSSKIGW